MQLADINSYKYRFLVGSAAAPIGYFKPTDSEAEALAVAENLDRPLIYALVKTEREGLRFVD